MKAPKAGVARAEKKNKKKTGPARRGRQERKVGAKWNQNRKRETALSIVFEISANKRIIAKKQDQKPKEPQFAKIIANLAATQHRAFRGNPLRGSSPKGRAAGLSTKK